QSAFSRFGVKKRPLQSLHLPGQQKTCLSHEAAKRSLKRHEREAKKSDELNQMASLFSAEPQAGRFSQSCAGGGFFGSFFGRPKNERRRSGLAARLPGCSQKESYVLLS
ncbi:MAG: hypothetical protein KDC66_12725, partial [Phaeodactylibacter sp.]|nr:hypothetical protein [Phaeodactylibacter sp.]